MSFLKTFALKHQHGIQRAFEILSGLVSWNLILFPYWGIFVVPTVVAYFILFFNIYWFYQSLTIGITIIVSHLRIQAAINYDWLNDLKSFKDAEKVKHVIIIPTYKEPLHILQRTLNSLKNQELGKKQLIVVLAMEFKEDKNERYEKVKALKKEFGSIFEKFFVTVHELTPGEVAGKASNERYAAIWIKKNYIDSLKLKLDYFTVTSCDADHVYHPKHFACLTFKFLDNPKRYQYYRQPGVLFYNNIWEITAITRVQNTLASIWNLSQLPRKDRLINQQNCSLSFKLLHEVDYWDADKIPEDWGIFFKAYYKTHGKIEVEPIYLPLYADSAQSTSFFKTLKVQYEQLKRWAWGVSDDPCIIKYYFLTDDIP